MDRLGKAMDCRHQHMRVFNKYDLPYRLHSVHSNRIPSLMLDVDLTWRTFFRKDPLWNSRGSHGWDNLYQEMQAIFVAQGPSFKSNYVAEPFENIQLYNLICALVNVTPAANNGTWGALHHLLVNPPAVDLGDVVGNMPQILRVADEYDLIAYDRKQDTCNNLNYYAQTESSSEEYLNEKVADMFLPLGLHSLLKCHLMPKFFLTLVSLIAIPVSIDFVFFFWFQTIDNLSLFNATEEVEDQLLNIHAPLGIPLLSPMANISNYGLLINEGYIAGNLISDQLQLD